MTIRLGEKVGWLGTRQRRRRGLVGAWQRAEARRVAKTFVGCEIPTGIDPVASVEYRRGSLMLLDCHVIAPERTAAAASRFLLGFLARPIASFDLADAAHTIGLSSDATLRDCFHFLEVTPKSQASFYWRNEEPGDVRHLMIAFNDDQSLSLGVSVEFGEIRDFEALGLSWLSRLKEATGATHGRFGGELPPISLADI